MKTPVVFFLTSLMAPVLLTAPALAQAPTAQPTAPPPAVEIRLQAVDAASLSVDYLEKTVPKGADQKERIFQTLATASHNPVVVMTTQIPADFPGNFSDLRQINVVSEKKGQRQRHPVTAGVELAATPHVNADGTIKLSLVMAVSQFLSATGVVTPTYRISTNLPLVSGHGFLMRGIILDKPFSKLYTDRPQREKVFLITVTVLPAPGEGTPKPQAAAPNDDKLVF